MDEIGKQKISAVVMIYNEERQIRECLKTITWADEIVICDSFSTDKTVEICREFTDKIYQRKFDNFGNQRRWLQDKPTHDWVWYVEGDERCSPELAREIRERLARNEGFDAYWVPFKSYNLGHEMKGKFWQFDKVRLYRKDKASWQDKLVHVNFVVQGNAGRLTHPVLHYPYPDWRTHFYKFDRMTRLEALQLIATKARVTFFKTIKELYWMPIRFYRFFFEFKDYKSGFAGFVFAVFMSFYGILTNLRYWDFRLQEKLLGRDLTEDLGRSGENA